MIIRHIAFRRELSAATVAGHTHTNTHTYRHAGLQGVRKVGARQVYVVCVCVC